MQETLRDSDENLSPVKTRRGRRTEMTSRETSDSEALTEERRQRNSKVHKEHEGKGVNSDRTDRSLTCSDTVQCEASVCCVTF